MRSLLLLILICCSSALFAQNNQNVTVSGRVTAGDTALVGVTVNVKGTATSTQTDADGRFTIQAPANGVLVFSYVGYDAQEVRINNRASLAINMQAGNRKMDEVVVVGYGSQKRATITGAVSNINSDDIARTTSTTTSGALVGKIQGITARQQDARPGSITNIQIRNMGTPLFVIDGVPADQGQFNQLGIGDIDNISVLKDASAAIYGLRAANGVILVTTKKGRPGKAVINIEGYQAYQNFTRLPKPPDAATYLRGLAWSNQNKGLPNPVDLTPTEIAKWQAGTEPGYQSVDYYKYMMHPNVPQSYLNASASGGSQNSRYYFSISHVNQDALIKDFYFKRTNFQSNIESSIAKGLKIGADLSGRYEVRHQTGVPGLDDYFNPFLTVYTMWPTETPYANNNPKYVNTTHNINVNPATYPEKFTGYATDEWRALKGIFYSQYDFNFGLSIKGTYQYAYTTEVDEEFEYTYDTYTYDKPTDTYKITGGNQNPWRRKIRQNIENKFSQIQATYNKRFGDHSFGIVAAYERQDNKAEFTDVGSLPQNNTVAIVYFADQNRYGNTYNEEARAGYIARLNYNYKEKYIVEALGRYDGSYLYAKDHRYGLFPGISVGWRILREPFMDNKVGNFFDDLKFRASYGETGSEIGADPFAYLVGYNYASRSAVFNGVLTTGVVPRGLPVRELTWVTNISKNIGLDFTILNNKLTGTFDIFERKRTGLPAPKTDVVLPVEVGYSLPNQNLESDAIKGLEGALTFENKGKNFRYSIGINGTIARLKILDRYNTRRGNSYDKWRNESENRWANINFGYHVIGRFQTQEQIDNYPINNDGQGNRTELPGDLIFQDVNGDKIINGMDQIPIGYALNTQPYASFGLNSEFEWRGLTLAVDFAGANLQTYLREFEAQIPFQNNGAGVGYLITDAWHHADPFDINSPWVPGTYPAVRKDNPTHVNFSNRNDFWMTNVWYVRLRNVQLGYNFPKKLLGKTKIISGLRVYVHASNLFSIDDMRKFDIDPEIGSTNALQYPQQRTYTFGFNLNL